MAEATPAACDICAISDLPDPKIPIRVSNPNMEIARDAARTSQTPHIDKICDGEVNAPIPNKPVTPADDPRHQ